MLNAILTLVAIPFLFLPKHYQEYFWYFNELTRGFGDFPRLALFTYEASYYSLLLIPVWYYYLLKFAFNSIENNKWLTVLLITIPMLLSLSFGVIGATVLVILILCLLFWNRLFKYKRPLKIIFISFFTLTFVSILLWVYFPENAFFIRLENIISGKDTSANGRTIDSFTMAWKIANLKNIFFGAGLGQIKIVIIDLAHKYYKYWGNFPRYDIPNAIGETLSIFGIAGVAVRLWLEIYLFVKTKVFSNYYRLALFIFIFIYQFTGSFITNIVEYVIWILAFSNIFEQFNIPKKKVFEKNSSL